MRMAGLGVLAAGVSGILGTSGSTARAQPFQPDAPIGPLPGPPAAPPQAPPGPPPQAVNPGGLLFADEFDGPAGSPPDYTKWRPALAREQIRNPVFWDRPENMGEYRDSRENLFLDPNGNLVIRATRENGKYFGAKVWGLTPAGMGSNFEARIKMECLTAGCWPAWWILNDNPVDGGEIDLVEWYGNGEWPSGTTVHTTLDGTSHETMRMPVDGDWHTWRAMWDQNGIYFLKDYEPGQEPYFRVPAYSMNPWPLNNPGYSFVPVFNVAVAGSGGGDPAGGTYPAQMLVDYVRIW